jgi:glutamate racemase
VPVLGVLEPGATAACRATRSARIAVIATESTVRGGAYQAAIARRLPNAVVAARACPLFVALAEEGWTDGPIVDAIAHRYLDDLFVAGEELEHPDTLVLGSALPRPERIDPSRRRCARPSSIPPRRLRRCWRSR